MPRVHRVASLLKRWLLGTHHGDVKPGQLDRYLEEFVFRFTGAAPATARPRLSPPARAGRPARASPFQPASRPSLVTPRKRQHEVFHSSRGGQGTAAFPAEAEQRGYVVRVPASRQLLRPNLDPRPPPPRTRPLLLPPAFKRAQAAARARPHPAQRPRPDAADAVDRLKASRSPRRTHPQCEAAA
jgi:hypothetical protein